jgi:hypothetical protein
MHCFGAAFLYKIKVMTAVQEANMPSKTQPLIHHNGLDKVLPARELRIPKE